LIPACSQIFENVQSIEDLPAEIIKQLEQFFIDYNKMEGKEFKVLDKLDAHDAKKMIQKNGHGK